MLVVIGYLLQLDRVLDVDVLQLPGRQPLQLSVELCHSVLRQETQ